jgi:type IV pilus assembly protein PilM
MFQMGSLSVGLDVGCGAVKVVALKNHQASNPKVVGVGYYETPQGCLVDGIINDSKTMEEIVKQALSDAGLKPTGLKANIGLRGLNVIYKNLLLAQAGPDEMQEQVLVEAQQLLDADLGEWIIDFQVVGDPDAEGQVNVILVAAKRSGAEDLGNLLLNCDIDPGVFDCDIFAFQNAVEKLFPDLLVGNCLLLDIGRDSTKIDLVQNGVTTLVRGISLGGSHLTEQITRSLGVDYDEAESIKISLSQSPEIHAQPEVKEAVNEHSEEILQEIDRTLEFFGGDAGKSIQIDRVILAGGGTSTGGLQDKLRQSLQTEVEFLDPFSMLSISGNFQDKVAQFPQVFSVAVGLALRKTGDKS